MQIFTLYNKKVGFYNPPTFSQMEKDAVGTNLARYVQMNPRDARIAHYDECELYYLGEFDDQRCEFQLLDKPEFILDLTPLFKEENKNGE